MNLSSQVLKYGSPTGTSTPALTVKRNCKLTGTETAKDGSQVQSSEPQNPEIKAIINNAQKGVTNDNFKVLNGELHCLVQQVKVRSKAQQLFSEYV